MIFSLQEELDLRLPPKTEILGGDITETKCLGRWPAEHHTASEGFTDASFWPANFVLLNENKFAVIDLKYNRTFTYTRLETEGVLNSVGDGDDEVTTNSETSAGEDVGATARAENDQQVVISFHSHL